VPTRAATREQYFNIVERVLFAHGIAEAEPALAEAFELGRRLVHLQATPDDIVSLQSEAVMMLGRQYPDLSLKRFSERINMPLLELTMAHGMAFRQQLERSYQEIVDRERATKLEALGTLSAGIAHDFNNIIGCIMGFAEMAGDEFPPDSLGRTFIEQINVACFRARDLVTHMLAYARKSPGEPVLLDVAEQIRDVLAILTPSLSTSVSVNFTAGDEPTYVKASPGQIHQIVMNLCINASHAMPDGGRIDIRIDRAAGEPGVPVGREGNVRLSIADTGCGMSQEVMAKAFDPFFTTKAPHGSGLGLSVTQGIVRQLGGEIVLTSRCVPPDTGTEFRIYLPVSEPESASIQDNAGETV